MAVGRREFLAAAGGGVAAAGGGVAAAGVSGGTPGTAGATADRSTTRDRPNSTPHDTELVVRFDPVSMTHDPASADVSRAVLEGHARSTREPFHRVAASHGGLTVEREFWLANAVLVTVDPRELTLSALRAIDGVTELHPNHVTPLDATAIDPARGRRRRDRDGETTPSDVAGRSSETATQPATALEIVDAPTVWEFYDTRGDGVDVAVLDTGVDPDGHEGLADSLDRGAWADFDERGNPVDSEPRDAVGHGTAVSGVIAGESTADGVQYGVAPHVALYHANVNNGGLRFGAVLAGLEWALTNDVDVVSLSIGPLRYDDAYVEPVRNLLANDIVVLGSIGNVGPDTSVSPANVPGVLGVGFVDDERDVHPQSGGERVHTTRYWGENAPAEWPETYVTPTVTAPGVDYPVPRPGGEYGTGTGGSYAAPAAAGVAALALAASDADGSSARDALQATARHPGAYDAFGVDPGHDTRYGTGIVNALAAATRLAADHAITGTVTDADGTPLADVTVASETGAATTTDESGAFTLELPPGEQPIGATAIGYEFTTATVDPASTDAHDFELEAARDLAVDMTARHAERVAPGGTTTATFEVANADTVTIEAAASGLFGPDQLSLAVDGTPAAFDEPISLDAPEPRTTHEITISTTEDAILGQITLTYRFANADDERVGESHRLHVHADPLRISPTDPPSLQGPIDLVAPRSTIELADATTSEAVDPDAGHALVVDKPLTLAAATDAAPRIEIEPPGDDVTDPTGVRVAANDVTIEGVAIDAPGATSAIQVGSAFQGNDTLAPSGVTIRDTTVSSAATGILGVTAPALLVAACDVTAGGTGVASAGATTITIRANDIHDVETGIDARSQVASIHGNDLTGIDGTAITVGLPEHLFDVQQLETGPVADNTVTNATVGIAVPGYTNGAIRDNSLTEIADTAILVEGGVHAPITNNVIDSADTAVHVADDATVDEVSNNALRDVTTAGAANRQSGTTTPPTTTTAPPTTTTAPATTGARTTPPATTRHGTSTSGGDTEFPTQTGDGTGSPTESGDDAGLASPTAALTAVAVALAALGKALASEDDGE